MHELAVTHEILEIVLRHARQNRVSRVHRIVLEIGELSDLEQLWIQRYFDSISRGSAAEGAEIDIEKVPCRFRCSPCGEEFTAGLSADEPLLCPACGSQVVEMVSGSEYKVKSMEAT